MTRKLPLARNEAVAVQELAKETLIYDFNIDKAYYLNETSSIIYRYCDGKTSFDDLKRRFKYTDDLIFLALDELQRNNLVKSAKITHFAGMSRREVIRKVGLGTMFALPIISALAAPSAAQAASNCSTQSQNCTFDNSTQSNCCTSDLRCSKSFNSTATTCQPCGPSGSASYFFTGSQDVDQATCNARPERNYCCNPAATPTLNGSSCTCG